MELDLVLRERRREALISPGMELMSLPVSARPHSWLQKCLFQDILIVLSSYFQFTIYI